jgi:hypothetical protein
MSLANDIERGLKQILGPDCPYVGSVNASRLKSGARVYRISGSNYWHLGHDGKILYQTDFNSPIIEVTRENLEELYQDRKLHIFKWEFYLLARGPENVARELHDALTARGHAVSVKVGPGGVGDGVGAGSAYSTSISVKQLSNPIQPGAWDAESVLGELLSISDSLSDVRSTVDDLSLRLRSLALTIASTKGNKNHDRNPRPDQSAEAEAFRCRPGAVG